MTSLDRGSNSVLAGAAALGLALLAAACAKTEIPAHLKPLSPDAMMLLGKKGMTSGAPIFVRVFKEESELEVWKQRDDGRFYHLKSYPICNWSGDLGPKLQQGDKQAPEGFYTVSRHQMNPSSQFHLAFNLGYPNAFDKAHRRTGEFLMVHGKCKSAGCYAMTDGFIEEIYALAREAFIGGQDSFEVHAFPFRMTPENLARHKSSPHTRFWATLKEAYDHFETTRQPPPIAVCERRYVVNVKWDGGRLDPEKACPRFERPAIEPFTPRPKDQVADAERIVAPGPRMRSLAGAAPGDVPATRPDGIMGLLSGNLGAGRWQPLAASRAPPR
jgi:murein L,D-transpeptidase YafK